MVTTRLSRRACAAQQPPARVSTRTAQPGRGVCMHCGVCGCGCVRECMHMPITQRQWWWCRQTRSRRAHRRGPRERCALTLALRSHAQKRHTPQQVPSTFAGQQCHSTRTHGRTHANRAVRAAARASATGCIARGGHARTGGPHAAHALSHMHYNACPSPGRGMCTPFSRALHCTTTSNTCQCIHTRQGTGWQAPPRQKRPRRPQNGAASAPLTLAACAWPMPIRTHPARWPGCPHCSVA